MVVKIICGVIGVLVGVLLWLVYANRGSDQVFEIIKPMALAVFGAWVYLAFAVLFPLPPKEEHKIEVLLFREPDRRLLRLDFAIEEAEHFESQDSLRFLMGDWRERITRAGLTEDIRSQNSFEETEFFLDLLELALFEWLSRQYSSHWDVVRVITRSLSGANWSIQKHPNAEQQARRIPLIEVMDYLKDNRLVKIDVKLG